MNAAFLTVNYKQESYLSSWTKSIRHLQAWPNLPILVCDNSNSIPKIDNPFHISDTHVFHPNTNLGYFGGFNFLLKTLPLSEFDFLILCNPDLTFNNDFFVQLNAYHSLPQDLCVIAPGIVTNNGIQQNPNVEHPISFFRKRYYDFCFLNYQTYLLSYLFAKIFKTNKATNKNIGLPRKIYMAHGSCFILTRHFLKRFSQLDDRVFLWGEEALLRKQVELIRGYTWFDPKLKVFHNEHSMSGFFTTKEKFAIWKKSYSIYRSAL
jgi:GT2 family glycosyltransferase